MKNPKKLIIITGPSGVGKGTVVKAILKRLERADFEMNSSKDFDYVLKNYEIDTTVDEILKIIS